MSTEVSAPIKIFAVIGLVLALGLVAMTKLKGSSTSAGSVPVTTPLVHSTPSSTTPAATAKPHAVVKPAVAKHAAPVTATHAAAKPKPVHVKARPRPAVAENGLPTPLADLLHIHRVVVVALYDPEVPTDKLFVAEAAAGAHDANAGFLAVSVLNERVAAPLTAASGNGSLLPSPGLLVYKQPALLMNMITGFIDRAAVADAVANALMADAPAQPAASASTATTSSSTPPVVTTTTATP